MLRGIYPIVFIPFLPDGNIDQSGLENIVKFELDGGIDGLGVNGFASEAYKMTDDERRQCIEIVAGVVSHSVPLIIGMAAGSTEAAIQQAKEFSTYQPAALMTLPPNTMNLGEQTLVEYYVALGEASDIPIMVQQSPHIQSYSATGLSADSLAEIAHRSSMVKYFKIEGGGSAERIAALRPLVDESVTLFGGGGGITLPDELKAGASGLIPGVGFNEYFVNIWAAWEAEDYGQAETLLNEVQPLVSAVSGSGHEYSLHARKYLMKRAGYIDHVVVRRPTVDASVSELIALDSIVDSLDIRISRPS